MLEGMGPVLDSLVDGMQVCVVSYVELNGGGMQTGAAVVELLSMGGWF
jgi:hypothetical protein